LIKTPLPLLLSRKEFSASPQVLPPQSTKRTEKDIGSENPETTTVSGFFMPIFKMKFKRGGLELNLKAIPVEKFETL